VFDKIIQEIYYYLMNKIKIVHIITKLELGGAQLNTLFTCQHLDEKKFEVFLFSGGGGILDDQVQNTSFFVRINHLVRHISLIKDFRAFREIKNQLHKIKPKIVHTHSSKAGIIGRLAAYGAGIPVIIHSVHGFSFSPFHSFFIRLTYRFIEKMIARITTHFVFVAEADIQIAKKNGWLNTNYSLIRSGFPLAKFKNPAGNNREIRQRFNIAQDQFVCGVIAPFKPQKNLFSVIEVAARVVKTNPKIVFFVCGDGKQRCLLEQKIRQAGLTENVCLPGFIREIETIIPMFDIGLSMALWEGLPQSLVQLRLAKKAVVASDIPGNTEVIKNNCNGYLVPVHDTGQFAEKIINLFDRAEERKRLEIFADDFSDWEGEVMVKKQQELYLRLVF
jgi:glycosyltransferase involved in cell wall biosynthesis